MIIWTIHNTPWIHNTHNTRCTKSTLNLVVT